MVGYDTCTKGYKFFNPRTWIVIISHDVTFDKTHVGLGVNKTLWPKGLTRNLFL